MIKVHLNLRLKQIQFKNSAFNIYNLKHDLLKYNGRLTKS
jgi:hypothetical protein